MSSLQFGFAAILSNNDVLVWYLPYLDPVETSLIPRKSGNHVCLASITPVFILIFIASSL